ncbi:MAG: sulfatase-like hydrolase/transferase, partial [Pirellulales bacterium]
MLLAGVLLSTRASGAQTPARPNVLLIMGDDHSAEVYGAYGNRRARTPNLDRLAAGGMRFDRAYCNSPVCT